MSALAVTRLPLQRKSSHHIKGSAWGYLRPRLSFSHMIFHNWSRASSILCCILCSILVVLYDLCFFFFAVTLAVSWHVTRAPLVSFVLSLFLIGHLMWTTLQVVILNSHRNGISVLFTSESGGLSLGLKDVNRTDWYLISHFSILAGLITSAAAVCCYPQAN